MSDLHPNGNGLPSSNGNGHAAPSSPTLNSDELRSSAERRRWPSGMGGGVNPDMLAMLQMLLTRGSFGGSGPPTGNAAPDPLTAFLQLTGNKAAADLTNNGPTGMPWLQRGGLYGLLDPRRDVDAECGYPPTEALIGVDFYRQLYDRESIATRVVQVLPKECWQVTPSIYEDEDGEKATEFEQAWDDLEVGMVGGSSWHQDDKGSTIN